MINFGPLARIVVPKPGHQDIGITVRAHFLAHLHHCIPVLWAQHRVTCAETASQ